MGKNGLLIYFRITIVLRVQITSKIILDTLLVMNVVNRVEMGQVDFA